MISKEEKEKTINEFKTKDKDTGSSQVQVALFTKRIKGLLEHFKSHPKDKHSRRGLVQLVEKRRSLLKYLKRKSRDEYEKTIKTLGLKK